VQSGTENARVGLRVPHRGEPGLGERVIYDEYVHADNLPGIQDQLFKGCVESFS
jgi:hypothetical protein